MNDSNGTPLSCSCFERRLQSLIDQRVDPQHDPHLLAHARQCAECQNAMTTWSRVQSLYAKPRTVNHAVLQRDTSVISPRQRSEGRAVAILTAVAAAIAFLFIAVRPSTTTHQTAAVADSPAQNISTETLPPSAASPTIIASDGSPRPSSTSESEQALLARQWIESMQGRDWMAETMPAVQSVGQGVAPLGRSLMQAVTILTQSTRNQTS